MSTPLPSRTPTGPRDAVRSLVADIAAKRYKNVVFMVGAGISTAAGIPDFRSPETGLYANLQKFDLPYPEAVFDIDYLEENPQPFFMLAREMFPTQFEPTSFHKFMKWVADQGVLKRVYTQNIDTLERRAGLPASLLVEAHGSFGGHHCIECQREADGKEHAKIEEHILAGRIPECVECEGIVKPNIVFFGEALPQRFFEMLEADFETGTDVDLVIVAGTSLQVSPFNQLPDMVGRHVPRYLFNLERVGSLGRRKKDVLVLDSLNDFEFEIETEIENKNKENETKKEKKKEAEIENTETEKTEKTETKKPISETASKSEKAEPSKSSDLAANLEKLNI